MNSPAYISIGTVIIDDVVLHSGETHMDCLGGGATHAIMGMRIWNDRVGILAKVGHDFPFMYMQKFEEMFNTTGLQNSILPTIRTWQLFEEDGTRSEVFRTSMDDFWNLVVYPEDIPEDYHALKGVHLHCVGQEIPNWVKSLREKGNLFILWEPWTRYTNPENLENLRQVLSYVDCFCPGLPEAQYMLEIDDPIDILDTLIEFGAKKVVIRMGSQGSIYSDSMGLRFKIPIVPVENIVDFTGAGNAYCGGFVIGMGETKEPQKAAAFAAVSASFALEQFGALYPIKNIEREKTKRFNGIINKITSF